MIKDRRDDMTLAEPVEELSDRSRSRASQRGTRMRGLR